MTINRPMFPPPLAASGASAQAAPERKTCADEEQVFHRTDITPEQFFQAYHPDARTLRLDDLSPELQSALARVARLRVEAAQEIERLLSFLDATEFDSDFEASLGHQGAPDECEPDFDEDDDAEEDVGDDEPSLGAIESHPSCLGGYSMPGSAERRDSTGWQGRWGMSALNDAEDEHDGREPDVDDEPALGALETPTHQDQAWAAHDMAFVLDGELDRTA